MPHDIPRRDALIGLGLGATGAGALVACGQSTEGATAKPAASPKRTRASSGPSTPSAGVALASLHDIAVGSSISASSPDGAPVILSRLSARHVVGFSAVCTHQGCTVKPEGARLFCPCHGSTFDPATGEVLNGPAQRALPAYDVTVVRGQVRRT